MDEREREIRKAHRHIRVPGGYVACACGEDWSDHLVHVAEKLAGCEAPMCGLPAVRTVPDSADPPRYWRVCADHLQAVTPPASTDTTGGTR